MNVLMISGDRSAIKGEKGPFYRTLMGLSSYWKKIDVLCSGTSSPVYHLNENTVLYPTSGNKLLSLIVR